MMCELGTGVLAAAVDFKEEATITPPQTAPTTGPASGGNNTLPLSVAVRLLEDDDFCPGRRPDYFFAQPGGTAYIFKENIASASGRPPKRRPDVDTWINSGGVSGGRNLKNMAGLVIARRRYGKIDAAQYPAGVESKDDPAVQLRYQQYTLVKQEEIGGEMVETTGCRLYHIHVLNAKPDARLGVPLDVELSLAELAEISLSIASGYGAQRGSKGGNKRSTRRTKMQKGKLRLAISPENAPRGSIGNKIARMNAKMNLSAMKAPPLLPPPLSPLGQPQQNKKKKKKKKTSTRARRMSKDPSPPPTKSILDSMQINYPPQLGQLMQPMQQMNMPYGQPVEQTEKCLTPPSLPSSSSSTTSTADKNGSMHQQQRARDTILKDCVAPLPMPSAMGKRKAPYTPAAGATSNAAMPTATVGSCAGNDSEQPAMLSPEQALCLLFDPSIESNRPDNLALHPRSNTLSPAALAIHAVATTTESSESTRGGHGSSRFFKEHVRLRRTPKMDRWASSGGLQGARDTLFGEPSHKSDIVRKRELQASGLHPASAYATAAGLGVLAAFPNVVPPPFAGKVVGMRRRYGRILLSGSGTATGERYHMYTMLQVNPNYVAPQSTTPDSMSATNSNTQCASAPAPASTSTSTSSDSPLIEVPMPALYHVFQTKTSQATVPVPPPPPQPQPQPPQPQPQLPHGMPPQYPQGNVPLIFLPNRYGALVHGSSGTQQYEPPQLPASGVPKYNPRKKAKKFSPPAATAPAAPCVVGQVQGMMPLMMPMMPRHQQCYQWQQSAHKAANNGHVDMAQQWLDGLNSDDMSSSGDWSTGYDTDTSSEDFWDGGTEDKKKEDCTSILCTGSAMDEGSRYEPPLQATSGIISGALCWPAEDATVTPSQDEIAAVTAAMRIEEEEEAALAAGTGTADDADADDDDDDEEGGRGELAVEDTSWHQWLVSDGEE